METKLILPYNNEQHRRRRHGVRHRGMPMKLAIVAGRRQGSMMAWPRRLAHRPHHLSAGSWSRRRTSWRC
jgi:hypothetical protein